MKSTRYLPILAIIFLLVGIGSSIYVNSVKNDSNQITINDEEYTVGQLSEMVEEKSVRTESGLPLDLLMEEIGISNPETHDYTIVGSDGYQKTVTWENMQEVSLPKAGNRSFLTCQKHIV